MRNWANGGWTDLGLLLWDPTLTYPSSTAYRATQFYQRESSSGKPELYIRYQ